MRKEKKESHTVFLDNNATTPISPEILAEMLPFLQGEFGNASSRNSLGKIAREAISRAHEQCANLFKCEPDEIIFTSGGTEAINTAIIGTLEAQPEGPKRIVTTPVEHLATLNTCRYLAAKGHEVVEIPVRSDGGVDLEKLRELLETPTTLVSIMWANNETGVMFPIREIASIAKENGCIFHTDAVQAVGKVDVDLSNTDVDLMSISGHKCHAPKGIGALFIRKNMRISPLLRGGHQEHSLRAGTENVAGIVGLGKTCEMINNGNESDSRKICRLRDDLEEKLLHRFPTTTIYGKKTLRVNNTSLIGFLGVDNERLLDDMEQRGVIASLGSACSSETLDPSHVLIAMGVSSQLARNVIRFSLSRYVTQEEIDFSVDVVSELIEKQMAIKLLLD